MPATHDEYLRWLDGIAPSLVRDHYTFKSDLLLVGLIGWEKNGPQGVIEEWRKYYPNIAKRAEETMAKASSNP